MSIAVLVYLAKTAVYTKAIAVPIIIIVILLGHYTTFLFWILGKNGVL